MATLTTQFAFRAQKAVGVVDAAPVYEPLSGFTRPEGIHRCCKYSPNGLYFAFAGVEDVKVINPDSGEPVSAIPVPNVQLLGFSPKGTYIITLERPSKAEDGNAAKNLKIWRTATAEIVAEFVQKGSQEEYNLQYTYDEKYCARAVTNEVQFYESEKMNAVWGHLRVEGVTEFAVSPGKNYSVCVFVAEKKGQPAKVQLFNLPDFKNPIAQKSFYKADKVTLKWNKIGTAVLVLTQTEVDKTGKSYYGETNLYLMANTGNFDCRVSLDKEGPIHDVEWSPNSREFGVVYGYMPAKTTVFNSRAQMVKSLELGPRNTILFSPHGRLMLVAGFGNLQGQMDIYDVDMNYKKLCMIEASNSSVCEWSPDGKYILTATTSPRLRVDNGVKLWYFTGELIYHQEIDELYNVYWRPQPVELYPLGTVLPKAPAPHSSALNHVQTKTPAKSAGAYRPPHARGQATPLLFKREDEGGAAHTIGSAYVKDSNGASNGSIFGKPRKREVPGAAVVEPPQDDTQLSKTALRNKKKREAAKKKAEGDKAQQQQQQSGEGAQEQGQSQADGQRQDATRRPNRRGNGNGNGDERRDASVAREGRNAREQTPNRRNDHRSRSRHVNADHRRSKSRSNNQNQNNAGGRNEANANGTGAQGNGHSREKSTHLSPNSIPENNNNNNKGAAPPPPDGGPLSPSTGSTAPEEKKRRALHKKLRAIEDLKMRQANGEKLEDTQIKKIATEAEVRKELEKLGVSA